MADDLAGFARKLERLQADLVGPGLDRALRQVGMKGKTIATDEVRSALGDTSMSNWRRGRPIQITSRFDVKGPTSVEIAPNRRAAGPMRVLTDGRRAGVSRKGRRYGATRGRGTWDRAEQKMQDDLPKVMADHARTVLRRTFGG